MIYANPLAVYPNDRFKMTKFVDDALKNDVAYRSDNTTVPLIRSNYDNIEFIGGRWRVQNDFPHIIQVVRKKQFVLLDKLPHQEKNLFEFYNASSVGCNCYGYFLASPKGDYVVARYDTDNQTYWSYGKTIEQARAFMGIKLYDEYMDLIHAHVCKQKTK